MKSTTATKIQSHFETPLIGLTNMRRSDLDLFLKEIEKGVVVPEGWVAPTGRARAPYLKALGELFPGVDFSKLPIALLGQILTEVKYL